MAEAEFETDSSVRGYHVCQDNWTPVIGERLNCEREEENPTLLPCWPPLWQNYSTAGSANQKG